MGPNALTFNNDVEAFNLIKYTHKVTRGGVIYPENPQRKETRGQVAAIDYLCSEWDYSYMKENPEEV